MDIEVAGGRWQVVIDRAFKSPVRTAAGQDDVTVGEWVEQALIEALAKRGVENPLACTPEPVERAA